MKQIILAAILIATFCSAFFICAGSFSPSRIFIKLDEYVVFDEYQNLNIKNEKERFDNLFNKIAGDDTSNGLIILRLDKSESRKKKIRRLQTIAKHFAARKVDNKRFNLAIFDDEKEQTIFYVVPKDVNLEILIAGENSKRKIIKAEDLKREIRLLFPKNKNYDNRNRTEKEN